MRFGLSALVALDALLWLNLWTLPIDVLLALDFRAFLPLFNDLTPLRALVMPIYLIFTVPFFFVEGLWLIGLLRASPKTTWLRTQVAWTVKSAFIKTIPLIAVLILQFSVTLELGATFISGYM